MKEGSRLVKEKETTNDLLISYHTAIEKRIWMMSAELGQRPGEGE